jgi:Ca2+-transporting ATPase
MLFLHLPGHPEPARVVRHARAARLLRLDVTGLAGQPARAEALELELRDPTLGVEESRASWRTGRVLLRYAPGAAILDQLHIAPAPAARPSPPLAGTRRRSSAPSPPWHALPLEEVLERLATQQYGLDGPEAARRLRRHGPNALAPPRSRTRLEVLRDQVTNLPVALLGGSALVAALRRSWLDAGAILSAVGLDVGIGYGIERRTEDLLSSWRRHEAGEARILREGRMLRVPAAQLVPGDVILCRSGHMVPADARVIDAHRLACDESTLTGESEPRAKDVAPVPEDSPVAERSSMLFAGTTVAAGRGRAVVIATGPDTEVAAIRALLEQEQAPRTPFEKRFDALGRAFTLAGVASGGVLAALGLLHRKPLGQVAAQAVALGVAAIPEGLPVVATAALVQSMKRLRKRGMIVRRLASTETLGGVTVVCADKTGTLTRNEMRAEVLDLGRGSVDVATLRALPERIFDDGPTLALAGAALNSDVDVEASGDALSIAGSSTERALVDAAHAAGLDRAELRQRFPRRWLLDRDRERPYVVSLHDAPGGGAVAFVKGAPERVIELCGRDLWGPLDAARREELKARNRQLAADGLRVLALAWRRLDGNEARREAQRDLVLIGLVGLRDPLREDAPRAVQAARAAGVRTLILTGDQPGTAEAVARAVGLEGEILDGPELAALLERNGDEIHARLAGAAACARVTPADKARIVRALRASGEVVAMAGDGVNDAPALKAADVGIAIGHRASGVSRQAADLVLAGEDLAAILMAIAQGRIVQDNLRRTVHYLLSTNLAEVVVALGAAAVGARDPFTPLRLLWLNLISDTLPAMALALVPGDGEELSRPPAPPGAPLVSRADRRRVARDGLGLAGITALGLLAGGPAVAFSTLAGAELGYAACRAPGAPSDSRTLQLLAATAALHGLTWLVPPLRLALGLPRAVSVGEIGGFAIGAAIPWLASERLGSGVIVRHGAPPARSSTAAAAVPQERKEMTS